MPFVQKNVNLKNAFLQKEEQSLICSLLSFKFKDEVTGFFVASFLVEADNSTIIVSGTSMLITREYYKQQRFNLLGYMEDTKYGEQFQIKFAVEMLPITIPNIAEFISKRLSGVNKSDINQLLTAFGDTTLKVINEYPQMLFNVGISAKKINTLISSWGIWKFKNNLYVELTRLGLEENLILQSYVHFQEHTVNIIRNNPYCLVTDIGADFKKIDRIAKKLGISSNNENRIGAALLHVLHDGVASGHTFLGTSEVLCKAYLLLDTDKTVINSVLDSMIESGIIYKREEGTLSLMQIYGLEADTSDEIKKLLMQATSKELVCSFLELLQYKSRYYNLDESQLNAIKTIFSKNIGVLTGGPGTGKTFLLKAVVETFFQAIKQNQHLANEFQVLLCAPTGMAAKQLEKATGFKSCTIHQLLGAEPQKFNFNEHNKLPNGLIIVDESSMMDLHIVNALLKAINSNSIIIFVGDTNQLEPIGPGKFLQDLISSEIVPVAKLTKTYRQSQTSAIIKGAYNIINKKVPEFSSDIDSGELVFLHTNGTKETQRVILDVATKLTQNNNPNNIQVLSPRKDGELGVFELNQNLRPILNKNLLNSSVLKYPHYINGDKIIQCKNNKNLGIYNGDTGIVINYTQEPLKMVANFTGNEITISGSDINELSYAYSITIHKSQGSEYPVVIIPIEKQSEFMLTVKLLFTAITRGKERVIFVGDFATLKRSVLSGRIIVRNTLLQLMLSGNE